LLVATFPTVAHLTIGTKIMLRIFTLVFLLILPLAGRTEELTAAVHLGVLQISVPLLKQTALEDPDLTAIWGDVIP